MELSLRLLKVFATLNYLKLYFSLAHFLLCLLYTEVING